MKKTNDSDILALCESKGLEYINRFVKNQETYIKCICYEHYEPYEFEISFRNLRNLKHSCPKCAGKNLTTQDIKYKVETLMGVPVDIVGKYVNMKTPIKTICKKCGKQWDANVVSLCQGSGCNKCKKGKPIKSHEIYIGEVSMIQPNLEITSQYKGDAKSISFRCKIDGYEGETKAGRLLSKTTQCRCCVVKKQKEMNQLSHEEFVQRVNGLLQQIEVKSQYNGYEHKVTLYCLNHNITFEQRAGDVMSGKCGCTRCVSSKGEKKIATILDKNNIEFLSQFKFDDCVDQKSLPFDFYLPQHKIAIEYQGEQHYKPVQFGGCSLDEAQSKFKIQKLHDDIKAKYCQSHNIKLLAIPYYKFEDIENIIINNV